MILTKNMAQLIPYLVFSGNTKEAMTFYQQCLGGKLDIQTVGTSQMAGSVPKEQLDNVLHSSLMSNGFALMAADDVMKEGVSQGNAVRLCFAPNSKEEAHALFAKLSAGGKVAHPLKEEFFGLYGDFTDKFGIEWMFQYSPNQPA